MNKKLPLISVIIPTFNTPSEILNTTICSVVSQSIKDFEIIIVDDFSSNSHTVNTIKSWAAKNDKIKPIFLQKNVGVAEATNIGVSKASGYFLAFLDHDDIWHWKKLEKTVNIMKQHKLDITIHLSWAFSSKNKRLIKPLPIPFMHNNVASVMDILLRNVRFTSNSQLVVKKSLFLDLRGFRKELRITGDRDFVIRAAMKQKQIVILPEVLTFYRLHDANLHLTKASLAILEDLSTTSFYFKTLCEQDEQWFNLFDRFLQRSFLIYAQKTPRMLNKLAFLLASFCINPVSFLRNEFIQRIKWRTKVTNIWRKAINKHEIEKEFYDTLKTIRETLNNLDIFPIETITT